MTHKRWIISKLSLIQLSYEDLLRDGFRSSPCFQALIAEWGGQTAAYALYFFTYSTWAGRPSLFVEDLFVRAEFRRKGIGKALLKHMAVIAREQNCYGMRWEVAELEHLGHRFLPLPWSQITERVVSGAPYGGSLRRVCAWGPSAMKPEC